jgi:hypothetical protein
LPVNRVSWKDVYSYSDLSQGQHQHERPRLNEVLTAERSWPIDIMIVYNGHPPMLLFMKICIRVIGTSGACCSWFS